MSEKKFTTTLLSIPAVLLVAASIILFGPAQLRPADSALVGAFAFCGGVLTACVSLIGILINRRSERALEQGREDERKRLRLDAAMNAGKLLSADDRQRPVPAVVASGLLALAKLNEVGLAVTLLVDLWKAHDSQVSTETAVLVIDAALRSDQPAAQLIAAEVLCRNAGRLNACQSLHWPSSVEGNWDVEFSGRTKLLIVEALVTTTLASPPNESAVRAIAVRLYSIWEAEKDNERIRGCVGKLLKAIISRLEHLGYQDFMQGNREVMLKQLCEAADSAATNPDRFLDQLSSTFADRLHEWSARCERTPADPGCLATAECGSSPFDGNRGLQRTS